MKNTPHSWSTHTKQNFPNWLSMNNESDMVSYFSQSPSFLCLIFKMISELGEINPIAYKVLERVGAKMFSAQLRKLCDFLLLEVTISKEIPKLVDTINDMVWKFNIVTIDRLVLCLALRTQEPNAVDMPTAQVFLIQLLLIKTSQFRDRVMKFVEKNTHIVTILDSFSFCSDRRQECLSQRRLALQRAP